MGSPVSLIRERKPGADSRLHQVERARAWRLNGESDPKKLPGTVWKEFSCQVFMVMSHVGGGE